ncbi:MAG: efflux RND transporter periplasmic adaptor subunit [Pirellulales bacterium]|nr:efflux RND transporter periplasmic adaptor subunit [Pirellulales bacterium]
MISLQARTARVLHLAAFALLVGCAPHNQLQTPPPPTVTVRQPIVRNVAENLEFTGTTAAVESVDVRARVAGFLDRIAFEEGQEVQAGQLLFVIDPRPFQAAVDQAEADLALARAGLAQAQATREGAIAEAANARARLQRAESARVSGAVTPEELDLRRTEVNLAAAQVDAADATVNSSQARIAAAQAAIDKAKLDLEFTQVKSPIDGRIGRKLVDVGNLVGSGEATLLTRIIRYDPIHAYFTVSEKQYLRWVREHEEEEPLRKPDADSEAVEPVEVRLSLADEEDYPTVGKVDFADLDIDRTTGTYLVRGVFDNPRRIIPPGAFVRLQISLAPKPTMLIDEEAIGRDQAGAYVRVVNSENVVETRRVALGSKLGSLRTIVSTELGPSERVVVNGLLQARPGMKASPQDAPPLPDAAEPTDPSASAAAGPASEASAS